MVACTDKVENPKKSVHFSRFEDGATHHRVIIFNVLVGPSLVKASLHDRAPKDAAKKGAHFTQAPAGAAPSTRRKMQLPNGRFQNLELFNFVQIMQQTHKLKNASQIVRY